MRYFTIGFVLHFLLINKVYSQTPPPTTLLESNQIDANYGWYISNAGDINADGYDDVVVGADWYDNGQLNEGAVFVHMGSATGLETTPAAILESNQVEANMGRSVSRAGDVNNDGYDDIIVSSWLYDPGVTNAGRVYIYHGSASGINTTPAKTIDGNQFGANFGNCVSAAGDVNNDGYDDVVVGAWLYDAGQTDEGRVYVFLGSSTGITTPAVVVLEGNQEFAHFGNSAAGAGDVNADGYDDIVVAADRFDGGLSNEGKVLVYHGTATGINPIPAKEIEGNQDNANFGSEVASAGDVNNDGYDDIIVGSHKYEDGMADEGAAFIFHGSATGIIATPVTMLQNNDVLAYFGHSVRGAGDFNQDGFDDVMVGSILFENGSLAEGSAYLYKGSASGIITTPYLTIEGNQSEANMGRSVSGAGDVNNDGFPDVMASANFYDNGQLYEGVVYVYHMCADSLYADLDGDGFGDPLNLVNICNDTINLVEDNTDCDDTNASIYPGAIEICNSLDDDCNTLIDEGLIFETYYADADADFFGDVNDAGTSACLPIAGTVLDNTDCDDTNAFIFPGGIEICNGLDDDCNTLIDEGLIFETYYADADADFFGDVNDAGTSACLPIAGTVTNNTDCDDANGDINSGETEICNLIDDNCDGFIDEGFDVVITTSALTATTFCQGGSVVLEASHNGIALQWKKNGAIIPGATSTTYTATKTGTYTCEASNLCNTAISADIVVTANKNPNANITADGPTTFCPGDNVNLNVTPVGGSAYQWYKGPTPIAGATSLSYTATTSGNYKCRVTKIATGCYKNSNTIQVNVMCKELVVSTQNNFTIFPNPATQEITITSQDVSAKSIYIIDAVGQVVQTILTEQTLINIDIQPYANGVYFIKINSETGSITKSFVKE